ncbi:MAG: hypothetical protein ACE5F5_03570 [Acidimicrobiia bacterium]
MPVRFGLLAVGMGLIVAACGNPTPAGEAPLPVPTPPSTTSTTEPVPPTTVEGPSSGLKAACGPVSFDWPVTDLDVFPPFEGDFDDLIHEGAVEEYEASRAWWESTAWSIAKRTETELVLFGQESASYTDEPQFAYASFEVIDGEWRARGWGGCRIQVVSEGLGIATFEIDRDNPPEPGTTTLHLLATERACASGQLPQGREIKTLVAETPETVEIILLVERPKGDVQTCQSNPAFPITVELDAPLGSRAIKDMSIYPGRDLPWPPPPADGVLVVGVGGDPPAPGTANVLAWTGDFAGALLFDPDGWAEWAHLSPLQGFPTAVTVIGFVTECGSGGCPEEVEGDEMVDLPRLGAECSSSWTPVPEEKVTMTIRYAGNTCTIEVSSEPIGPSG